MKIVAIYWLIIILECLVLIALGMFKKLTRLGFAIIAALTVVGCLAFLFIGKGTKNSLSADTINEKEVLYMSVSLIENEDPEGAINALNQISDEKLLPYEVRALRGLAYNLNGSYVTCVEYLNAVNNASEGPAARSEYENVVLSASMLRRKVAKEQSEMITAKVSELVDFDDDFKSRLAAEAKIKYGTFSSTEAKEEAYANVDMTSMDYLTTLKNKINKGEANSAYADLLKIQENSSSVRDDILVTNMYINFVELHSLQNEDSEYDYLFAKANAKQVEYNKAAIEWLKFSEENSSMTREEYADSQVYRDYVLKSAEYEVALKEYRKESYKRAINYLQRSVGNEPYGYSLQMAKLHFLSDDTDAATEYLDNIYKLPEINTEVWLGYQLKFLEDTYLEQNSEIDNYEFDKAFELLMNALYQNVFPNEDNSAFKEFVKDYFHNLFMGISVSNVNTSEFPVVTVDVSTASEEISVNKDTIIIEDTFSVIDEYEVSKVEVSETSICFVQDISGSMGGTYMADSKNALLNASKMIKSDIDIGLVSFDNEAYMLCQVGSSRAVFNNCVNTLKAAGGTNISAGLRMGESALHGKAGKKVIMLLSDGYDGSANEIDGVLRQLQAEDIVVYAIGLQGCDENYMQKIAVSTGGEFIKVDNTHDLTRIYDELSQYMTSVYRVRYTVDVTKINELIGSETINSENAEEIYRYVQASGKSDFSRARCKYTLDKNTVSNYVDPNESTLYTDCFRHIISK